MKPEYPCTACGSDAFISYSAGKRKSAWGGLVQRGERLCTRCFQSRGGVNFFAPQKARPAATNEQGGGR
jgi:hypothetical protein